VSLFGEWLGDAADDEFERDEFATDSFPDDEAADRTDEWDSAVHDWGWS